MTPVGIGERLRNAREALGLSLEEIESATKIRRSYLEALEQEAFTALPGPAYVRGFLRAYAAHLGIPPEEILQSYPSTWVASPRESPVEVRLTPAARLSPARGILIGVGVLLALGAVALGIVLYGQIRQFAETPAPGPTPARPTSPSRPSPPLASPQLAPLPSVAPPPARAPAPAPPSTAGTAAAAGSPPGPTGPPGVGPSYGTAGGPLHVAVTASGRSWVRAVVDGTTVFEGFLNPGDRQVWQAGRTLTVRVGNAGAVAISLNGQPMGPLGSLGAVYQRTFSSGATNR